MIKVVPVLSYRSTLTPLIPGSDPLRIVLRSRSLKTTPLMLAGTGVGVDVGVFVGVAVGVFVGVLVNIVVGVAVAV